MSNLYLSLLGAPRIECDGASIHISRHKAIALLVYLAVTGQPHRRDALAVLLWPEQDQSSARASLRRALAALREALGDRWLDADRESVNLNWDAGIELDVRAFRQRLVGCAAHCHTPREDSKARETCAACMSMLAEAADLYGSDFLAGFTLRDSPAFDDWQFLQTQSLRDELAGALERLVNGHSARGEFEQAIPHARRWLALDPLHEPAHRWLIQLYAWADQRAAALRQYEQCEQILEDELGASPEGETVALYQAIVEHRELPSPVSGNLVSTQRKHNLPAQVTPFVGREATLSEIGERLADPACRLLTLVGPGGSGKTRLALETASRRLDDYEHGVFFVSLAPLDAVESIVPTVAQALAFSFHGEGEPKTQLLAYLRNKHMLLILDNYEHLLEGATLATEILQAAPQVAILATSRVGLHVQGEHRFLVEGMDVPEQKSEVWQTSDFWNRYSAIRLFLDGARRAQPDFELSAENVADVVRICRLVEGMPLGILLAATWVSMLTPARIAAEISRTFDFLESGERDTPARQRSLRAVFDHSWQLLSEQMRAIFAALAVFRGGFTDQAAKQVTNASLRDLLALADKSLVHRISTDRYEVHELLRQYAAEKLAESPDIERQVRDRHSAYYAVLSVQWETDLKGARQLATLEEMDLEVANIRVAWDRLLAQGEIAQLDHLFSALCLYADWRNRPYYAAWFDVAGQRLSRMLGQAATGNDKAIVPTDAVDVLRLQAKLWAAQSYLDYSLDFEKRADAARQCLSILDRAELRGRDLRIEKAFALASLALLERNEQAAEQSLALYRDLGDPWGTAAMLEALCYCIPWSLANYDRVRRAYQEALSIAQVHGDLVRAAGASHGLATLALHLGQLDEAERLALQALDIFQHLGARLQMAWVYSALGMVAMAQGQFARAWALHEHSVELYMDSMNQTYPEAEVLLGLSELHLGQFAQAQRRGEQIRAFCQGGRADQMRPFEIYALLLLGSVALVEEDYAKARALLEGRDPSSKLFQGGRHDLDHAPSILACALRGLGQRGQARRYLLQALRLVPDAQIFWPLLYALAVYALLLLDEGKTDRAVELYALASRYPFVANSRWFEEVAGKHIAAAAEALLPDAVAAAQERGRARDLETTAKALLTELEADRHIR
ncbi:MAG: tetratricopeptide repeat protein [Anaerolineae bacterium]|nr:tetratricopeptide repeat protein [Anaerolineae bacterium]